MSRMHGLSHVQTVGFVDTGLDYDHCFFRVTASISAVTDTSPCSSLQDPANPKPGPLHRKIISYELLPGAKNGDAVGGHGMDKHTPPKEQSV